MVSRDKVVSKARSQLNYTNAGNRYGSGNWCAHFVCYVYDTADGIYNNDAGGFFTKRGRTDYIEREFRNNGKFISASSRNGKSYYVAPNGRTPQAGDLIFFDRYTVVQDSNGNDVYIPGANQSSDHIGIVTAVSGNSISFIDGNNNSPGNKVQEWTYSLNDAAILGYGLVSYNDSPTPNLTPTLRPDNYESNNTRTRATILTGRGNSNSLSAMNIHNSSDVDYYKITLKKTGTRDNNIKITSLMNGLEMRLEDANGKSLAFQTANSNSGTKTLYLDGKRAGTYYLKVSSPAGRTGQYKFANWNTLSADDKEGNNSISNATRLSGNTGTMTGLNIHTPSDVDYYKFELKQRGTSTNSIMLGGVSGEQATLLDSRGNALATSRMNIALAGRPAGTYYLKVASNATQAVDYKLTWNITPSSLSNSGGSSSGSSNSNNNNSLNSAKFLYASSGTRSDSISRSGEQDYFRIQLNSRGTSSNYVQTSFTHSRGDIDMDLLDSSGHLLVSKSGSSNSERIDLNGRAAGTYYVRVKGYRNATNNYSISWNTSSTTSGGSSSGSSSSSASQREYESNNSRYSADSLSGTTGTMNGAIGSAGDEDWFKFNLSSRGTANNKLELTSGSNSQRLVLYDANGSKISGSLSRSLSLSGKAAGTYYVKVYDSVGFRSGDYTMTWDTASNARSASAATSRAATPSLTSAQNVMYDSTAGAFAGYLNSAGATTQTVSQSTSDSLRKYGTLVQA